MEELAPSERWSFWREIFKADGATGGWLPDVVERTLLGSPGQSAPPRSPHLRLGERLTLAESKSEVYCKSPQKLMRRLYMVLLLTIHFCTTSLGAHNWPFVLSGKDIG